MNDLVDLWVTQTDGKRTKTQFPEKQAFEMAKKLSSQYKDANPLIGYLY